MLKFQAAYRARRSRWQRRFPVAAVTALVLLAAAGLTAPVAGASTLAQATGDAGIEIVQNDAQVNFPSEIRFQLRAESPDTIAKVSLEYQVDDSRVVNQGVPAYSPGSSVTAIYAWRVSGVLLPGSEVRYQWVVETTTGRRLVTPIQDVAFSDTRFPWRERSAGNVLVQTYVAERTSSDTLVQLTTETLGRIEREFGLTLEKPLRIFGYATQEHYLSAMAQTVAGQPAITVGTDRIIIFTGLAQPMLQQVLRREVAQALFRQRTRNAYTEPPLWLTEGFAQYISPEEQLLTQNNMQALRQLAQSKQLLSLRSISGSFPTTQRENALARVESYSVVRYIVEQHGAQKLRVLLLAIKEGNAADDGLKQALGLTMDQLEGKWKDAVKAGRAARPPDSESAAAEQRPGAAAPTGPLARATEFWRGVFGDYTQWVLIGAGSLLGLTVVLLILGSLLRRHSAEEEL